MQPFTLLATLALVLLAVPSTFAAQPADDLTKMLCLVNAERSKNGLKPLGMDSRLNNASKNQSTYMARKRRMSHSGEGGSSPGDRVKKFGVKWKSVAENVAEGYTSIEKTMKAWMDSPGHRRNILGKDYTMFGSSVVKSGGKAYYTQDFANDGSPAKNIPSCDGSSTPSSDDTSSDGKSSHGGGSKHGSKNSGRDRPSSPESCDDTPSRPNKGHSNRHGSKGGRHGSY